MRACALRRSARRRRSRHRGTANGGAGSERRQCTRPVASLERDELAAAALEHVDRARFSEPAGALAHAEVDDRHEHGPRATATASARRRTDPGRPRPAAAEAARLSLRCRPTAVSQTRRCVRRSHAITRPPLPRADDQFVRAVEPRTGGSVKSWSRTSCEHDLVEPPHGPVARSSASSDRCRAPPRGRRRRSAAPWLPPHGSGLPPTQRPPAPSAVGVHQTPPPEATRGFAHAPAIVERRQRTAPLAAESATTEPLPPALGADGAEAGRQGRARRAVGPNGAVRWRRSTMPARGRTRAASGGGVWWTPTRRRRGGLWRASAIRCPGAGAKAQPNGGAYRGAALYTDSLLALDLATGGCAGSTRSCRTTCATRTSRCRRPRATRSRELVVGARQGRAGDRVGSTHAPAGLGDGGRPAPHDSGPLPGRRSRSARAVRRRAHADGVRPRALFVPVVDLCMRGARSATENLGGVDVRSAAAASSSRSSSASGRVRWRRALPSPPFGCATVAGDVVFAPTYDGRIARVRRRPGRRSGAPASPPASTPARRGR